MPHDRENARVILGVRVGATVEEITMAWRRLAMKLHPDRQDGDGVAMSRINQARDVLLAPPEPIAPARRPPREPATYSEYLNLHRRCV
jgi:DnaJ domain